MKDEADFQWLKKHAKNEITIKRINAFEKKWKSVMSEGRIFKSKRHIQLNIGGYKIWLREGGGCSSMDTYTEIFKYNRHMLHQEFCGETDKVIVDAGANEGYYTLKIKQNNPKCRVLAIEPNPLAFKILKKNINTNKLKNVQLINKMLGHKCGKTSFELVDEISAIGSRNIQKRPWLEESRIKKIIVWGITLCKLCQEYELKTIDILKLDVEGDEMEILISAKNFVRNIRKIVVEYHSKELRKELIKFLTKNDFKLVHEERGVCGDLYFINALL
ncbi:MAG: FkbM family methyltransferase [Nanoarchaeota archaeon]|nr:FkbM family methyltransferase [Nanoarchaeota archaeon]